MSEADARNGTGKGVGNAVPADKRRRIVFTWGGTKKRPNRLTGRAGVLALVVSVLAIALVVPVRQYVDQRRERADLREQTKKHEEEVARLREELARWNDPAYVRQQARLQLHFVNPGDTAYSVIPPAAPPASTDAHAKPQGKWPESLWTTVQQADADPPKPTPPPPPPPPPTQTIKDPRTPNRS